MRNEILLIYVNTDSVLCVIVKGDRERKAAGK